MPFYTLDIIPPVIAHRGVPLRAPENTMASFIAAHKAGATWLETDVKLTADGVPVLMHDDTLERTTNGRGPLADMTWAHVQKLDAGSGFSPAFAGARVAAFAELVAFVCAENLRLFLELKPSPGRSQATAMVTLIEASKLWPENKPPPVISSFDVDSLLVALQLHPDWPRALFLDGWRNDWAETAASVKAVAVAFREDTLSPERLDLLRGSPLPALAYTVNDPARAKDLLENGIAAIFSDDVEALLKEYDAKR